MKLLRTIITTTESRSLGIILLVFSLLRLPSLFEPLWYGDEGIYQVLGRAVLHGATLYQGIWDNKPPFLYLTYALVNADQFAIRLLSFLAGILSVYGFYLLTKRLFTSHNARTLSTALFAILFSIPATEANIANAENFLIVFVIFAGLCVFEATEQKEIKKQKSLFFIAGLLIGVAFLFKTVAILDLSAFLLFAACVSLQKNRLFLHTQTKNLSNFLRPLLGGFILPFLLTCIAFLITGSLSSFLSATFTENYSYVGYKNFFLIPQGLLIAKLLLLLLFIVYLFRNRVSFSSRSLFILFWFSFSILNVFFSQRAYTHYLLVGIAAFSLLVGLTMSEKKQRLLYI
ncbi:MAG: hypothetical protein RLZZ455_461, partial [Candidatus Parcubacteria bacterium]